MTAGAPGMNIIRLELPSDFRWLDVLNASLNALAEEMDWDSEFSNAVSIAAIEAASNAIEHGNGLDTSKSICVQIALGDTRFVLGVCDDGEGVDASVLERPLPGPEDLAVRGRGFAIMKALMDEVRFLKNADGRFLLELEKALPQASDVE